MVLSGCLCGLQLQLSMEEARSRLLEMEQELTSLHEERAEAQKAAFLLQNSLDKLAQVRKLLSVWYKYRTNKLI